MRKTVIFLGSYSGSGATTAIKLLRKMDVPCVSTHELIYEVSEDIDQLISSFYGRTLSYTQEREYRKRLAEDTLKRILGRSVLAWSAANKLKALIDDHDIVLMECFDQWDYVFAAKEISEQLGQMACVNITSPLENPHIDKQKLLQPLRGSLSMLIENPMTEDGLTAELQKMIKEIKEYA